MICLIDSLQAWNKAFFRSIDQPRLCRSKFMLSGRQEVLSFHFLWILYLIALLLIRIVQINHIPSQGRFDGILLQRRHTTSFFEQQHQDPKHYWGRTRRSDGPIVVLYWSSADYEPHTTSDTRKNKYQRHKN